MKSVNTLKALTVALATAIGASSCVHQYPEEITEDYELVFTVLQDTQWLPDYDMFLTREGEGSLAIRYDFRVYPKGNTTYPVKEFTIVKEDLTRADYTTTVMLPEGEFDIYCWSDYCTVADGAPIYYDDSNFGAITYIKPYEGDTELRDAFRGVTTVKVEAPDYFEPVPSEGTITLSRPVARYRIYSIDLEDFIDHEVTRGKLMPPSEVAAGANAARYARLQDYVVKVIYPLYMPAVFDNFSNNPIDSWTGISFTGSMVQASQEEALLAFDYVYVNGEESGVQVMIEVYDPDGMLIARSSTMTIPTKRNRTTNVYGKFLTTLRSDGVGINPDFDGEYNIELP